MTIILLYTIGPKWKNNCAVSKCSGKVINQSKNILLTLMFLLLTYIIIRINKTYNSLLYDENNNDSRQLTCKALGSIFCAFNDLAASL